MWEPCVTRRMSTFLQIFTSLRREKKNSVLRVLNSRTQFSLFKKENCIRRVLNSRTHAWESSTLTNMLQRPDCCDDEQHNILWKQYTGLPFRNKTETYLLIVIYCVLHIYYNKRVNVEWFCSRLLRMNHSLLWPSYMFEWNNSHCRNNASPRHSSFDDENFVPTFAQTKWKQILDLKCN